MCLKVANPCLGTSLENLWTRAEPDFAGGLRILEANPVDLGTIEGPLAKRF